MLKFLSHSIFLLVLLSVLQIFAYQSLADDLLQPRMWWYGNATPNVEQDGMVLAAHFPEVTLTGTAMNPANLTNFTLKLRWNFGGNSNGVFSVGWGKPHEWSDFQQSAGWVTVRRDGWAAVYNQGKELGEVPVPVSNKGDVSFTIRRRQNAIVLISDGKETPFPLPANFPAAGGYLTLRSEGYEHNVKSLRVESAEIEGEGNRAPLSAVQRQQDIRQWETEQVNSNWNFLANFEAYFKANGEGQWKYKTDLRVEPGLVQPGETVRLYFRCAEPISTNCTASVQADYLNRSPGAIEPLALHWRATADNAYEAVVKLKPEQVGNWHVVWRVGEEELSRIFGVVDTNCAVVRLMVTADKNVTKSNAPPAGFDAIHDAELSCDFWNVGKGLSLTPKAELARYQHLIEFHHRWGDEVMPMMHADAIVPGIPDKNFFKISDDLQREGMRQHIKLWDMLGIGPLQDMGGYTWSDSSPKIARSLGIKALDTLCQWQNWTDLGGDNNGWQINDWGAPTVPYYVAKDDFRKVALGQSIVMLPQTSTSDVRIYSIYTSEGQPQQSFLRQHSDNGKMGESWNIDRFEAAMNLLFAESRYQKEPLFLSVALENFFDLPDWNEANRLGVDYLIKAAPDHKVVFTHGVDIADYYQRHYKQQPENWFYWPDIYAGLTNGYKPPQVPDRIELSNARFHVMYQDGSPLPQFFWDYTRPWSELEWAEEPALRQKYGLINPALITASNCVPRMVDLTGVSATVTIEQQDKGAEVRVAIESPQALKALPVALWRIPLYPQTLGQIKCSQHSRFVRVVDGATDNLNGVLVCDDVPSGQSVWTVNLQGKSRAPLAAEIHIGDKVSGRFFPRANGPSLYVWLSDEQIGDGVLTIQVPANRQVIIHYNDGTTEQAAGGSLQVKLDHTWQHLSPMITGLTTTEIQAEAHYEQ